MQSIRLAVLTALAPLAFAQALPQFEVASIKPTTPGADFKVNLGIHVDGAMVTCMGLSLKDYIRMAYEVKDYQIVGPEWMAANRFDLSAKLPAGGNREQVRDMIKSLLAERFHLKLHTDSKDFPVYALVLAKGGSKLKESAVDPDAADVKPGAPGTSFGGSGGPQGVSLDLGAGAFFSVANNRIEAKRLEMARFAELMSRFMDKPVVDFTGLAGHYDLSIEMTAEDYQALLLRSAISAGISLPPQAMKLIEVASGDSLYSGLQSLGLKLESRKAPLPVLVIDQADKAPTEN